MKFKWLILTLMVCMLLSGCSLFTAEVTRPTEPPMQQAPATEPATQPTTEPTTEPATEPTTAPTQPVEDVAELDVLGQWNIDSRYTVDKGGISPLELYGSAIREGEGMTFSGDGTFTYYAGTCYGEGTFSINGNEIRVTLHKGEPTLENNVLVVEDGRIAMDQYGDGNLVWWARTAE